MALARERFADLYQQLTARNERLAGYDARIELLFRASPVCRRLTQVEGVGPLTATALAAVVGDARVFQNGRQMTPRHGLRTTRTLCYGCWGLPQPRTSRF